jgi:hypothetical protein
MARQSGDPEVTDANTRAELEAANADRVADSIAEASGMRDERQMDKPSPDSSADTLRDSLAMFPLK